MSPSGFAFLIASWIVGVRKVLVKAMKPSRSPGGWSPCLPPSETIHLPSSIGKMKPPRRTSGGVGRCTTPVHSVGASAGISKIAVAYPISMPISVSSGFGEPILSRNASVGAARPDASTTRSAARVSGFPASLSYRTACDRAAIVRRDDFGDARLGAKVDVRLLAETSPTDAFEQRARQAERIEAEVAPRERIVSRPLEQ